MNKNVAIIGAGITGLSLAFFLKKAGIPVKVFEKNARVGGVIRTKERDGFVYEQGPNSGTLSNIEIINMLNDLEDDLEVETGNAASQKRLIWKNKRWEALPSSLGTAVKTPLFTLKDKIRILGEPFRPKSTNPDESISDMVIRRLGKSFLDYAVDPFVSGIYAGDPNYLVTKYALPKLYNLEQNYDSFIRGAIKMSRLPKSEDDKKITKEIFSVKGGLEQIVKTLAKHIGHQNILLSQQNIQILQKDQLYLVNGQEFTQVITTVRAGFLPDLLPFISKDNWQNITNLRYAPVTEIGLGFKKWDGMTLDAFGGLVPMKEKRHILGMLFMSSIFNGRAPQDGALFTLFIGGSKHPELTQLPENQLLELVKKDFMEMTGIMDFKPDLISVKTYSQAIAQYGKDSDKRLGAISDIRNKYPGLFLAGSISDGVGLADRVKQARQIADQLINF